MLCARLRNEDDCIESLARAQVSPQENTYDDDTFYLLARTLALLRSNASGYKFVGPFSLVHNREVAEGHPDRTPEIHVRYLRAGRCRAHDYLPLR